MLGQPKSRLAVPGTVGVQGLEGLFEPETQQNEQQHHREFAAGLRPNGLGYTTATKPLSKDHEHRAQAEHTVRGNEDAAQDEHGARADPRRIRPRQRTRHRIKK